MNDKELENECWMRARCMAGELFDEPDYNTATALLFLGSHAVFARGDQKAASYYNLLSETMCENLAYTNSEVYMRALTYGYLVYPTTKNVQRFQGKVKAAQKEPYHFVMTSSLFSSGISDLLGADVSRIASYNRQQLQIQKLISMLFISVSMIRFEPKKHRKTTPQHNTTHHNTQ